MPDDIVERLSTSMWLKGSSTGDLINDAREAIERLRAAGDDLAYWLRAETVNGSMAVCEGTNEALHTWQEARRG